MKWKDLRGFKFPLVMEEINKVKSKYLALVQQIQKTNQEKDRKLYLELRKAIEDRIIEIDEFIEENFDQQFVLHFEKCKLKLKKLLQITPKEKLTKTTLNKNFKDLDVLNKVLKKQQEKNKELEKEREKMLNEPIYNKLPEKYELYENLIETMKNEEMKNKKEYYKNHINYVDYSVSSGHQSIYSNNDSHNVKNILLSFGKNNNINKSNPNVQSQKNGSNKDLNLIKNKNNFPTQKKYK